jgi:signal transduction histidine kinase
MKGLAGSEDTKDGSYANDLSFAYTAAHELKAPLALIRQLTLLLEDGVENEQEWRRMLRQVTLTAERGLRLTENLTRSSRLDDSLFTLEPINPQQLLEEVAHEFTPLYKAKDREIRVASRYRPMLMVANRDLLYRILANFADNALHYADKSLPVELYAGKRDQGEKIRVSVRDYGPAVPPKLWKNLEANLGKGRQTLHMRPQSSGLGLFVAGQFAEAMNGAVGATRHKNGATFYVDMNASRQLKLL